LDPFCVIVLFFGLLVHLLEFVVRLGEQFLGLFRVVDGVDHGQDHLFLGRLFFDFLLVLLLSLQLNLEQIVTISDLLRVCDFGLEIKPLVLLL